jgi:hypothetical protein
MENRVSIDGALYPNRYKDKPNKPDITGEITLSKDLLKSLVTLVKEGKEAGLKVAIWNRESKAGNPYQYIKCEAVEPKPKKEYNGGGSSGFKANPPSVQAEDPDDPLPF